MLDRAAPAEPVTLFVEGTHAAHIGLMVSIAVFSYRCHVPVSIFASFVCSPRIESSSCDLRNRDDSVYLSNHNWSCDSAFLVRSKVSYTNSMLAELVKILYKL